MLKYMERKAVANTVIADCRAAEVIPRRGDWEGCGPIVIGVDYNTPLNGVQKRCQ